MWPEGGSGAAPVPGKVVSSYCSLGQVSQWALAAMRDTEDVGSMASKDALASRVQSTLFIVPGGTYRTGGEKRRNQRGPQVGPGPETDRSTSYQQAPYAAAEP